MTLETITRAPKSAPTQNAVNLDPSMEAEIAEFNAMKVAIKALEAKKAAAEASIRAALAGSDVGLINGVERVRVQHRNMSKIDRELLKTAFPEAHEATMVQSSYTVLQAK
jgi:predicted phage-related endonuclease